MAQREKRSRWWKDGFYISCTWTQVVSDVLHIDLSLETFNMLAEAAEPLQPRLVYQPRPSRTP
jgi:hypothetical protein